ncbi:Maf family protein [Phenylobacterium sp.]|uniref:Maf family protein n=1 Tax=Phenylobacterium sp. TaxID=1871053 RepID=UPI002F42B77A
MTPQVVLASQSGTRKALLQGAGVAFAAVSSGVDEDAVKRELLAQAATPREIAGALAERKALRISAGRPEYVIGADQTLELEGRLYDKVATLDEARERLALLRGRTHRLEAAVVVAKSGAVIWRETATATLTMRVFSDAFLQQYLAREGDDVLSSVGCYRLEGLGAQLFSHIDGDYFAILGLPMLGLLELLRGEGVLTA